MRDLTFPLPAGASPTDDGPSGAGGGIFVSVVGPSGVGKDALIRYARERLSGQREFVFARRIVTRPADPASEDHDSIDPDGFEALLQADRLALWWEAHGLRYGLPKSLCSDLGMGRVVVANVSRQVLRQLHAQFPRCCVVAVSAHPDVVAARLAARGREDAQALEKRRSRLVVEEFSDADTIRIENSGPLAVAGDRLVEVLGQMRRASSPRLFHSGR